MTGPFAGDPIRATDVSTFAQYTTTKPLVKLVQQAAQSCTSGTTTAVTFAAGSEEIDTNNFHDTTTNNTRITPTVAGYYSFEGSAWFAAATTTTSVHVLIAKNGTNVDPSNRAKPANANQTSSSHTTTLLSINGTGDFVELKVVQVDSGAAARNTEISTGQHCTLIARFERPL